MNSRVEAGVIANVDEHMYVRMDERKNGRKTRSLYHAMPEAGATKTFDQSWSCLAEQEKVKFCRKIKYPCIVTGDSLSLFWSFSIIC